MENKNKYSCVFDLVQHTPLIHFQALQKGASLRATELKPKFDRFLKEKLSKELKKDDLEKLYLNGQNAFDYKVFIEPILSEPINFEKYPPLFFGNIKPKNMSYEEFERIKKRKKKTNSLKIKFYSFKPEMIEYINKYFEAFLANTNFGTRQSKGFGSFYLDKDFDVSLVDAKKVYSFNVKERWDKDIELFYKFLRSGINAGFYNKAQKKFITKFYCKPLIFLYAKKKNWVWDKKAIKRYFFNDALKEQIKQHPYSDVLKFDSEKEYILRDIFGLSTSQQWGEKYYDRAVITKESVKKINGEAYYARMKSPITFKVIKNKVYFWVNNHYKKILGEEFIIKVDKKEGELFLSFPEKIDLNDVIEMIRDIDLNKIIRNKKFHQHDNFQKLNFILEDIKASL